MEEKQLYLSLAKKTACNIIDCIVALAAIAVILLAYFGVINLDFGKSVTGIALAAVGLIFFINALVQGNSVSMWLAFCFLIPAAISFACKLFGCSYAKLYPLYIALPGLACLGAMIISREFLRLLAAAAIFVLAGAIFLLQVFGVLSLGYTFIILVAYIVLLAALFIIYLRKGDKK